MHRGLYQGRAQQVRAVAAGRARRIRGAGGDYRQGNRDTLPEVQPRQRALTSTLPFPESTASGRRRVEARHRPARGGHEEVERTIGTPQAPDLKALVRADTVRNRADE